MASVATSAILIAALVAAFQMRRPAMIVGLAIAAAFLYGRTLILSRPFQTVCLSSKLIDQIRAQSNGFRFAIADRSIRQELPPNQEALFGLRSVNSIRFALVRKLCTTRRQWSSKGTDANAKKFDFVDIELALRDNAFPLSNVGILLSAHPLTSELLELVATTDRILLYRPKAAPVSVLQTNRFRTSDGAQIAIKLPLTATQFPTQVEEEMSDYLRVRVSDSAEDTLLFLSQQYFPRWRAFAGDRSFATRRVNEFYQGVIVPHTFEVELFYRPFAWWSWLPQVVFGVIGVWLGGRILIRRFAFSSGRTEEDASPSPAGTWS